MGLWQSFKDALGLNVRPTVRTPPPLALTHGALARLSSLPEGHGLVLRRLSGPAGPVVTVDEAPVQGPFSADLDDLPIDVPPELREALRGLTLDHDDGRWRLSLDLVLRARETPNPDGRLYEADRILVDGRRFFPAHTRGDPDLPPVARTLLDREDVISVLLRGPTLTIERLRGAPWDPIDRAVGAAVRAHLLGGAGVVEALPPADDDDPLLARVRSVIDAKVRPALHADGGDLDLLDVRDGVVTVRLVGACTTCPASALTLHAAVERTLRDAFPGEIDRVVPAD